MKRPVVYILALLISSFVHAISLLVEISIGELIDKITILEIKANHINDEIKLKNIANELDTLTKALSVITPTQILNDLTNKLRQINQQLWDIEDAIRLKELNKEFDDQFIELARSVYFTNDERGRIKKEINQVTGSRLVEEKSYQEYGAP